MKKMKKIGDILHGEFESYKIEYRIHASRRMFQRRVSPDDVELVLKNGLLIEEYQDDMPFPSVLLSGVGRSKIPLHVVAALNKKEKIIIVITVYRPASEKWTDNYSRRLK